MGVGLTCASEMAENSGSALENENTSGNGRSSMSLDWMPRDNELKNHGVGGEQFWGTHEDPPCTSIVVGASRATETVSCTA